MIITEKLFLQDRVVYEGVLKRTLQPVLFEIIEGKHLYYFTQFSQNRLMSSWEISSARFNDIEKISDKPIRHKVYTKNEIEFLSKYKEREVTLDFLLEEFSGRKRCSFEVSPNDAKSIVGDLVLFGKKFNYFVSVYSHSNKITVTKNTLERYKIVMSFFSLNTIVPNFKKAPLDGIGISIGVIDTNASKRYRRPIFTTEDSLVITNDNIFYLDCVKIMNYSNPNINKLLTIIKSTEVVKEDDSDREIGELLSLSKAASECQIKINTAVKREASANRKSTKKPAISTVKLTDIDRVFYEERAPVNENVAELVPVEPPIPEGWAQRMQDPEPPMSEETQVPLGTRLWSLYNPEQPMPEEAPLVMEEPKLAEQPCKLSEYYKIAEVKLSRGLEPMSVGQYMSKARTSLKVKNIESSKIKYWKNEFIGDDSISNKIVASTKTYANNVKVPQDVDALWFSDDEEDKQINNKSTEETSKLIREISIDMQKRMDSEVGKTVTYKSEGLTSNKENISYPTEVLEAIAKRHKEINEI